MEPNEGAVGAADREAIVATARDYIESWLDGDADRMARCLHPELAKRTVERDPDNGATTVETTTRDEMVAATAAGLGRRYERPYDLRIDDAFRDIASVRVRSSAYLDYLHIARFDDRWLIVNVLWQRRPGR
jgi:hypothetical protein